jgi:hypothetical protein
MSKQQASQQQAKEHYEFCLQCKHIVDEMLALIEMVGDVSKNERYLALCAELIEAGKNRQAAIEAAK